MSNKAVRVLVAVMALAVAALIVSFAPVPKNDILEIEEEKVMTEVTPVPMPDDELIHTVELKDIFWDSDAHWLAMALERESGVDWPDWAVIMVGDVIMHRVASDIYPNTVKEVLLDPGQYEPFFGDFEPFMPEQRYVSIAERILKGETCLADPDILYQALFPQGQETVVTFYDPVLDTTTYFCK